MRILYIIDSLVPGGAERSLAAMAPLYAQRGVTLEVAYLHDRPGLQSELREAGAQLHCLAGPGGRIGWIRRARQMAVRLQPDLVHTTLADANIVGRIAANLARVPVVSSLVNVQYGPEHASDPNVLAWRMRLLQTANTITARRVRRFHAVTHEVADVMAQRLRIPRARIDVIPRGRDPMKLGVRSSGRGNRVRQQLGVAPETHLILAAAREEHQKRLDLLLEALPLVRSHLPDARMVIAGRQGGASALLRDTVRRLGIDEFVEFLGQRSDVPDLLCAADVLVLPSRREGLPGILVEALALEAPIVATDLPGVREVVGEDTAVLISTDRPGDLALGICESLTDVEATAERTRRGRTRFLEHFAIERATDEMISFYERALEPADRGRERASGKPSYLL